MGKREDMRGKSRIAEDNRAGGEGGEWERVRKFRRTRPGEESEEKLRRKSREE